MPRRRLRPGNPGAPEDYTDLTPPDTQVDSGPADGDRAAELPQVLRFTGTDNVAPATALRFECRLDPPADPVIPPEPPEPPEPGEPPEVPEPPVTEHWEECASPVRFAQMFTGEHKLRGARDRPVRQHGPDPGRVRVERLGGPDRARTRLRRGRRSPTARPTRASSARRPSASARPTTRRPDRTCATSAGSTAPRTRPARAPKTYEGLSLGDHTFEVRARDVQGNRTRSPRSRVADPARAAGHEPAGDDDRREPDPRTVADRRGVRRSRPTRRARRSSARSTARRLRRLQLAA